MRRNVSIIYDTLRDRVDTIALNMSNSLKISYSYLVYSWKRSAKRAIIFFIQNIKFTLLSIVCTELKMCLVSHIKIS